MTIGKVLDYSDFLRIATSMDNSRYMAPLPYKEVNVFDHVDLRSQELLKDKVGGLVYGVTLDRFLNVGGWTRVCYLIDSCSIGYILRSNHPESLLL